MLTSVISGKLFADTALQLISTMQSSNWNIPKHVQSNPLHQDRLISVSILGANCVNTLHTL